MSKRSGPAARTSRASGPAAAAHRGGDLGALPRPAVDADVAVRVEGRAMAEKPWARAGGHDLVAPVHHVEHAVARNAVDPDPCLR